VVGSDPSGCRPTRPGREVRGALVAKNSAAKSSKAPVDLYVRSRKRVICAPAHCFVPNHRRAGSVLPRRDLDGIREHGERQRVDDDGSDPTSRGLDQRGAVCGRSNRSGAWSGGAGGRSHAAPRAVSQPSSSGLQFPDLGVIASNVRKTVADAARSFGGAVQQASAKFEDVLNSAHQAVGYVGDQADSAVEGFTGRQPLTAAQQPLPSDWLAAPPMQRTPTTPAAGTLVLPSPQPTIFDQAGQAATDAFGNLRNPLESPGLQEIKARVLQRVGEGGLNPGDVFQAENDLAGRAAEAIINVSPQQASAARATGTDLLAGLCATGLLPIVGRADQSDPRRIARRLRSPTPRVCRL
jgi:hypothetical protein